MFEQRSIRISVPNRLMIFSTEDKSKIMTHLIKVIDAEIYLADYTKNEIIKITANFIVGQFYHNRM